MSNAFVPVKTMLGWLQAFVRVTPVTQVIAPLAVRSYARKM